MSTFVQWVHFYKEIAPRDGVNEEVLLMESKQMVCGRLQTVGEIWSTKEHTVHQQQKHLHFALSELRFASAWIRGEGLSICLRSYNQQTYRLFRLQHHQALAPNALWLSVPLELCSLQDRKRQKGVYRANESSRPSHLPSNVVLFSKNRPRYKMRIQLTFSSASSAHSAIIHRMSCEKNESK
jgi:hypothetical protein